MEHLTYIRTTQTEKSSLLGSDPQPQCNETRRGRSLYFSGSVTLPRRQLTTTQQVSKSYSVKLRHRLRPRRPDWELSSVQNASVSLEDNARKRLPYYEDRVSHGRHPFAKSTTTSFKERQLQDATLSNWCWRSRLHTDQQPMAFPSLYSLAVLTSYAS